MPSSARTSIKWELLEQLCSSRLTPPPRLMSRPGARLRLELITTVFPHHMWESTTTQGAPSSGSGSGGVSGGVGGSGGGTKKGTQRGAGGTGHGSTRRPSGFEALYRFVNGSFA